MIPENAAAILDEAIEQAIRLESALSRVSTDPYAHSMELQKISEEVRDLMDTLAFRWCKVDQFAHTFRIRQGEQNCYFVYWTKDQMDSPAVSEMEIPTDLGYALGQYENMLLDCRMPWSEPHYISEVLLRLKQKVLIQQEDKPVSAEESVGAEPEEAVRLYGQTSEMQVPDNALAILDEVIEQAEKLEALNVAGEGNAASDTRYVLNPREKAFYDLCETLNLLGFRWCKVDPVVNRYRIEREDSKCYFVHWHKDNPRASSASRIEIPCQLYHLIWCFVDNLTPDRERYMASQVRSELQVLRQKVLIQQEIKPLSIDGSHAAGPVRPLPVYEQPTEMMIPDNALVILDNVIEEAEALDRFLRLLRVQHTDLGSAVRASNDLSRSLNVLVFRWCGVDPFSSDYLIMKEGARFFFVYWPKDKPRLSSSAKVEIPAEMGAVLEDYAHNFRPERPDDAESMATVTRDMLSALRRKVQVHLECKRVANGPTAVAGRPAMRGQPEETSAAESCKRRNLSRKAVSTMNIPADAEQLIEESLEKAYDLEKQCESYFNQKGHGNDTIDAANKCCDAIESFLDYWELFAYRWAKFDPLVYAFTPESAGVRWYFHFFIGEIPPGLGLSEEIVYIPPELYAIYSELCGLPRKTGDNDPEFVKFGHNLCKSVTKYLTSLKQMLDVREAVASGKLHVSTPHPAKPYLADSGRTIVCLKGSFTFTKAQKPIVEVYWDNYLAGNEFLAEQDALEKAGLSTKTFESLFKSKKGQFRRIFKRHETETDLYCLDLE